MTSPVESGPARAGGVATPVALLLLALLRASAAAGQAPEAAATASGDAAAEEGASAGDTPAADAASEDGAADGLEVTPPEPDEPEPPESYTNPPPPPGPRYPAAGPSAPAPVRTLDGALRIPAPISARLRVLSLDLDALSARGGSSVASGILSVVTGGLAITLGLLFENDAVATFFYVFGGASAARGIFDLALSPDPHEPALEYAHLPMRSPAEVRLRLQYGEHALEDLATRMHLSRIVDGTLSIAAGVLIVPLALAPDGFEFDDALDYFVVIGASISVLSGVISLVSESEAERRWHAYRILRAKLRRAPRRASTEVRLRVAAAPLPDGAAVALSLTF